MDIKGLDYREYFYKAFNQSEDLRKELEAKSAIVARIYENEKTENYHGEDKQRKQDDVVELINKVLVKGDLKIESETHDFFKDTIIKVVDDITGEIVSEIPSKALLDMVAEFCKNAGVLIDKKA